MFLATLYLDKMTLPQPYRPDPRILELGTGFYDPVSAAGFPECQPRFLNLVAAAEVGLEETDWARHFCRFNPLTRNLTEPLALRYQIGRAHV